MSVGDFARDHWPEWAASGVVGTVAYNVAAAAFGAATGSYATVVSFAASRPLEVAAWTASWVGVGALVGVVVRGRMARGELAGQRSELERALAEQRAESERALAEQRAESERALAEQRAESERALAEQRAESERALAEQRSESERAIAERDARIAELCAARPTREEVREAISTAQLEVARRYEGQGVVSDAGVRVAIERGSIAGFEREALERVLGLDATGRRWLMAALEDGYVDVRDDDVGWHDPRGDFRALADEEGAPADGVTRYALRKGVRGVLRDHPEAFDVVRDADRRAERAARLAMRRGEDSVRHLKVSPDEWEGRGRADGH